MSLGTSTHGHTTPHNHTHTSWALSATSTQQNDIIPVPRSILVRLLTHIHEGNRRFPTRHLAQATQMLHHILGIGD